MSDLAIRVENYILSRVEGLSKLYPSTGLRAGRIGRAQQRHDTTSTRLSACLCDALVSTFKRSNSPTLEHSDELWALRDVSFEACPECNRRVKRGELVGVPSAEFTLSAVEVLRAGIGRNGAGKSTLPSAGLRTRLKILSRITEPTGGRAETCPEQRRRIHGRVGSLVEAADAQFQQKR